MWPKDSRLHFGGNPYWIRSMDFLKVSLASGKGIVVIGVCVCAWESVCLSVRPAVTACRNATLISAVKVMCCIQCFVVDYRSTVRGFINPRVR